MLTVLGAYSTDIVETLYDDGIITGVVLKLSCVIDGKEISVVEAGDVENPTNWKQTCKNERRNVRRNQKMCYVFRCRFTFMVTN